MKKRYEFEYLKYIIESNMDRFNAFIPISKPTSVLKKLFKKGTGKNRDKDCALLFGTITESSLYGQFLGFFGSMAGGKTKDNIKLTSDKCKLLTVNTFDSSRCNDGETITEQYNRNNGDFLIVFVNGKCETFNYYIDNKRTLNIEEVSEYGSKYVCALIDIEDCRYMHNSGEEGIHIFCCSNEDMSKMYFVDAEALYNAYYVNNRIPESAKIEQYDKKTKKTNILIRPWKLTDDIVFHIIR